MGPGARRGFEGKLRGFGLYWTNLGAFLECDLRHLFCRSYPTFLLTLGFWAGCGVSGALSGDKGARVGGQKVSRLGLPGALRGVKGKLGAPART